MKNLISVVLVFIAFSSNAMAELSCSAHVNGDELNIEKTASGLYMIAIEDPHFDEYDVVIDARNEKQLSVRLAKFIATSKVNEFKAEIQKVSENMREEILKLAKARVVDSRISFANDGVAQLSLRQGDDLLEVLCLK